MSSLIYSTNGYDNGRVSSWIRCIYNCYKNVSEEQKDSFGCNHYKEEIYQENPEYPAIFRDIKDDVRSYNDLHIVHPRLGTWVWAENTSLMREQEPYYWTDKQGYRINKPIPREIWELRNKVLQDGFATIKKRM